MTLRKEGRAYVGSTLNLAQVCRELVRVPVQRSSGSCEWGHMSIITTLIRLRQEDHCEFEAGLG